MKAHHHNKGCVLQLDPYQQEMHKEGGSFGSFLRKAGHALAPLAKVLAPVAKDLLHKGINMGGNYLTGGLSPGLSGGAMKRKGKKKAHHASHEGMHYHGAYGEGLGYESDNEGEGFFGDMAKNLAKSAVKKYAPMAIDAGTNFLKSKLGGAARRRAPGRRGRGLFPAGY
jgi:hypothetical protein